MLMPIFNRLFTFRHFYAQCTGCWPTSHLSKQSCTHEACNLSFRPAKTKNVTVYLR